MCVFVCGRCSWRASSVFHYGSLCRERATSTKDHGTRSGGEASLLVIRNISGPGLTAFLWGDGFVSPLFSSSISFTWNMTNSSPALYWRRFTSTSRFSKAWPPVHRPLFFCRDSAALLISRTRNDFGVYLQGLSFFGDRCMTHLFFFFKYRVHTACPPPPPPSLSLRTMCPSDIISHILSLLSGQFDINQRQPDTKLKCIHRFSVTIVFRKSLLF